MSFHEIEIADFKKSKTEELNFVKVSEFDSLTSYRKLFEPFLIKSSDRSRLIDLDSYKLTLEEEDGNLVAFGSASDTEVVLFDFNLKKKKRLAFYGSAVIVEDAY